MTSASLALPTRWREGRETGQRSRWTARWCRMRRSTPRTGPIPSPDAVGEFKVQTGVLTADVGRYSGGIITISSQSGTNDYHGRLFYYGRNHNLNSNSWQNNSLGVEKQPFHQHNYGLAVGGPLTIPKVIKERTRRSSSSPGKVSGSRRTV